MEVLCSSQDDRCIAISVPIQFETPIQTPDELEAAFRALADKADDARREADPDALPRKAEEQCVQLQGLLALLNRDFESHLRYFALVYAKECIAEEELERANLVVLTYEGLTLELLSRDLVTQSRRLSEVSISSKSAPTPTRSRRDRRDGAKRDAAGERDELRADGSPPSRGARRFGSCTRSGACYEIENHNMQRTAHGPHTRVAGERPVPHLPSLPALHPRRRAPASSCPSSAFSGRGRPTGCAPGARYRSPGTAAPCRTPPRRGSTGPGSRTHHHVGRRQSVARRAGFIPETRGGWRRRVDRARGALASRAVVPWPRPRRMGDQHEAPVHQHDIVPSVQGQPQERRHSDVQRAAQHRRATCAIGRRRRTSAAQLRGRRTAFQTGV